MSRSSPPLARTSTVDVVPSRELSPELRERIAKLTERLRNEHEDYERAAKSWTKEAAERKRRARKARDATLQDIEQALARDDDRERLACLERLPFARKLVELEAWVERAPAVPESRPEGARAALRVATPVPARREAVVSATANAHLPVLPSVTRSRRWLPASVTTRSWGIGAAVVAVVGWRVLHRGSTPAVDEMPGAADQAQVAPAALDSASHDPAPTADPAFPSPTKRTGQPLPHTVPPKPRLTAPSAKRGSL